MTQRFSPTIRRRLLGMELRRIRVEDAKMSTDATTKELDISLSKLNKIENGRQDVTVRDLIAMLTIYGTPNRIRELTDLRREAHQDGWWEALGVSPGSYVDFEAGSSEIKIHAPLLLPGILQTEDYARAVFRELRPDMSGEDIDREVEVRMRRRDLLDQEDGPRMWVILGEAAVRYEVGGRAVMADALDNLVAVAAKHPRVTVQLLPYDVGANAGMEGPFSILFYEDAPTVAHVEYPTGAIWLEKVEEISRCTLLFDHLQAAAAGAGSGKESLRRIKAIRDGMRTNDRPE